MSLTRQVQDSRRSFTWSPKVAPLLPAIVATPSASVLLPRGASNWGKSTTPQTVCKEKA